MGAAYRCETCGTVFDRPALLRRSQRMPDGFRERLVYRVCPVCGGEETEFEDLRRPAPWGREEPEGDPGAPRRRGGGNGPGSLSAAAGPRRGEIRGARGRRR